MSERIGEPLKILFMALDGIGHMNACVGLAQPLKKRGHTVKFITNELFSGTFEKFGFDEIVWKSSNIEKIMNENGNEKTGHPTKAMASVLDNLRKTGFLSGKDSIDKLQSFEMDGDNEFANLLYQNVIDQQPHIVKIIEDEQPDLFILDQLVIPPCILFGNIPWASLTSTAPLFIHCNSPELPPATSGYPSNDRTHWDEFRQRMKEKRALEGIRHTQNLINDKFGYPKVTEDLFFVKLAHLVIYGYPAELDYTDIIPMPANYIRLEAFCRDVDETFELPEEFKSKIQPGDKLIYLSMGSIGSIDVDLMKRLVEELSRSKHKFLISTGPSHDKFELSENMWGKSYLPQTKLLPLVDLVITHGGNNSVCETFINGKSMIVMPLFGDQYDNAQRILEKGYGYRLDPYGFEEGELNQMIDKILNDETMLKRCRTAADRISKSNSKQIACEKIENFMLKFKQENLGKK